MLIMAALTTLVHLKLISPSVQGVCRSKGVQLLSHGMWMRLDRAQTGVDILPAVSSPLRPLAKVTL